MDELPLCYLWFFMARTTCKKWPAASTFTIKVKHWPIVKLRLCLMLALKLEPQEKFPCLFYSVPPLCFQGVELKQMLQVSITLWIKPPLLDSVSSWADLEQYFLGKSYPIFQTGDWTLNWGVAFPEAAVKLLSSCAVATSASDNSTGTTASWISEMSFHD